MSLLDGFNINTFRSSFGGDLEPHHNSHFEVLIIPPASVTATVVGASAIGSILRGSVSNGTAGLSNLRMRCSAINFPGKSVGVFDYTQVIGPNIKIANTSHYDAVNLEFILTQNGLERQIMMTWLDFIQPTQLDDMDVAYYDSYTGNVVINIYDTTGKISQLVRLGNAFPVAVGGVSMNWSAMNQISTFPVSMAFESMQAISPQALPQGAADLIPTIEVNLSSLISTVENAAVRTIGNLL